MAPEELFTRRFRSAGVSRDLLFAHSQFLHAGIQAELLAELHLEGSANIRPVETPAFLSYPQEWCFSQWKDTLISFLAIEVLANEAGLTHAAINISDFHFSGGKVRAWAYPALDALKPKEADQRWNAFNAFANELLAPTLLLAGEGDVTDKLLTSESGPLSETFWGSAESVWPALIKSIRKMERLERPAGLIEQVLELILDLRARPRSSEPKATDEGALAKDLFSQKQDVLDRFFSKRKFGMLFDLNAGRGEFSRLIEPYGKIVVALDTDHDRVDENYRLSRYKGVQRSQVIPLMSDIVNPATLDRPEALPIEERATPDIALVLSADGIAPSVNSLARLIKRLADMRCEVLIEAGAPASPVHDPLAAQTGAEYSKSTFEQVICEDFRIKESFPIDQGDRQLYRLTLN